MILASRSVPLLSGATAFCFALGLSSVLARDNCAAYGPGFTSVEGSDTCIRIGGRVRVEAGTGISASSINNGWAAGSAHPASLHSETSTQAGNGAQTPDFGRSHLRLPQGALGYAADPAH